MLKDNRTKLKARHGANSSLKVQNSSFDSSVINMSAGSEKLTKGLLKKNDVTGEVTHFSDFNNSETQCFTSRDNKLATVKIKKTSP